MHLRSDISTVLALDMEGNVFELVGPSPSDPGIDII